MTPISWDESQAFQDWQISVSHVGSWSESLDPGTGGFTSTSITTVITAVRSHVRSAGVTANGTPVQFGDRWYRVRATDVTPAMNQRFVDAGVTYRVLDWETTSDGLVHKILTRRV